MIPASFTQFPPHDGNGLIEIYINMQPDLAGALVDKFINETSDVESHADRFQMLLESTARIISKAMVKHLWTTRVKDQLEQRVYELEMELGERDAAFKSILVALQKSQARAQKSRYDMKKMQKKIDLLEARPRPKRAPDLLTLEALRVALGYGRCKKLNELETRLTAANARVKELEARLLQNGLRV